MHAALRGAPLLACITLACGPQSGGTATEAASTSTSDPGTTSTTDPGTTLTPTTAGPGSSTSTTDPVTSTASPTTTNDPTGGPSGNCLLEPEVAEECDNFLVGYWFDPQSESCRPFDHGECGGEVVPFTTLEACQGACEPCEAFVGNWEPRPNVPVPLQVRNASPLPIYLQTFKPDDSAFGFHEQIFKLGRFDFGEDLLTAPNVCDFPCAAFDNPECAAGCSDGGPPPPPIVIHPGGTFTSEWNGLHFGTVTLPDRCLPAACEPGLQCGRWLQASQGDYEVSAVVATMWDCVDPDCTCDANPEGWCQLESVSGDAIDPQTVGGTFFFPGGSAELVFE